MFSPSDDFSMTTTTSRAVPENVKLPWGTLSPLRLLLANLAIELGSKEPLPWAGKPARHLSSNCRYHPQKHHLETAQVSLFQYQDAFVVDQLPINFLPISLLLVSNTQLQPNKEMIVVTRFPPTPPPSPYLLFTHTATDSLAPFRMMA